MTQQLLVFCVTINDARKYRFFVVCICGIVGDDAGFGQPTKRLEGNEREEAVWPAIANRARASSIRPEAWCHRRPRLASTWPVPVKPLKMGMHTPYASDARKAAYQSWQWHDTGWNAAWYLGICPALNLTFPRPGLVDLRQTGLGKLLQHGIRQSCGFADEWRSQLWRAELVKLELRVSVVRSGGKLTTLGKKSLIYCNFVFSRKPTRSNRFAGGLPA